MMSINQIENETTSPFVSLNLGLLKTLSSQAPFSNLLSFLSNESLLQFNQDISLLTPLFFDGFGQNAQYRLSPQSNFTDDKRYYEEIIYDDQLIPTRDHWHDFFNGLIWHQFSEVKAYFNQQHIKQLNQAKANSNNRDKKRHPIRDKITHFDECGLVVFTNCAEVEGLIAAHNWHELFVVRQGQWFDDIRPVIFGHALWEMLLQPFIGITAKCCVIYLDDRTYNTISQIDNEQNFQAFDQYLLAHIIEQDVLQQERPWLPLPLLGIPGWSPFSQDDAFYRNQSYFMPKRQARMTKPQK